MIHVAYRHDGSTGQPAKDLSANEIWEVARRVRAQITDNRSERGLPVETLVPKLSAWDVNGVAFEADWDLDHKVVNRSGKPVMGVTEYDPASPACVMVSINGPKLSNEALLRSTIAHELGHVVFEGPGWVLVSPAQPVQTSFSGKELTRDPREMRANEFMGALLVPLSLVRVDLQRLSRKLRASTSQRRWITTSAPGYDVSRLDPESVTEVIFDLAERYGVSESFMQVRLDRYGLLRNRLPV